MCGIAGISGLRFDPQLLRQMAACLAHRGPDAQGFFQHRDTGLAHLRLSILDVSDRGNQPMSGSDGRYSLVHNGEVYNFQEIKSLLPPQEWKTGTDTEVILAAYHHWGPACLDRMNGMFAMAIYDRELDRLFIARDRLGIKPLYYHLAEGTLSFASEVRALLQLPHVPKRVDRQALAAFLSYQSSYGAGTLCRDVQLLGAGEYLIWEKGSLERKTYWRAAERRSFDVDMGDRRAVLAEVRKRLDASVQRRLLADVPLGAFLSGGIDSSAIVALMARGSAQPVETFSVVFEEEDYDESPWSEMVSRRYATRHHPILLKPQDFLDELPAALAAMDHPSGDGLNSYMVSKVTRAQGIKVALSGLGGDELFAGYPHFTQLQAIQGSAVWKLPAGLRRLLAGLYGGLRHGREADKKKALLRLPGNGFRDIYPVYRTVYDWDLAARMAGADAGLHPLAGIVAEADAAEGLSKVSVAEIRSYTQAVLLRDMDQMSMVHALEARVPFFDHELVEFVLAVPDAVKWPAYPKQLLVEAMGDLLPREVVHRKKMGFVFPWEAWLRGPLRAWAGERLATLRDRDLIDPDALDKVWREFQAGKGPWLWPHVWLPVVLEEWLRKTGMKA